MNKRQFTMKIPTEPTKNRIKEVQFYLIITQIKSYKPHVINLDDIIENLALLYDCKITNIEYAITNMGSFINKPTPLELGLAHKYADIPIRSVCALAKVANKTIYDALERYVENGSPDLTPKFSPQIIDDIEKFNRGMGQTFERISHVIREGVLYDRCQEIW